VTAYTEADIRAASKAGFIDAIKIAQKFVLDDAGYVRDVPMNNIEKDAIARTLLRIAGALAAAGRAVEDGGC